MSTALVQMIQGVSVNWMFKCGNILDEPAEVLVCSANVSLNLSGGVGADLLGRYGIAMQKHLHELIASRSPRAARVGEIFSYHGCELPYRGVLHAVAVDGWYHTSPEIVQQVMRAALGMACGLNASKVTLTALATGFGDLSLQAFASALKPLMFEKFPPITEVCICLQEENRVVELVEALSIELSQ